MERHQFGALCSYFWRGLLKEPFPVLKTNWTALERDRTIDSARVILCAQYLTGG